MNHKNELTLHHSEVNEAERAAMKGTGLSLAQLRQVKHFVDYIELIRLFSKRYTLLIAAKETAWGPNFTEEIAERLMSLGLQESLYKKYRHSYVAIIDAGEVVFESLSPTVHETIDYTCSLNDIEVNLVSGGFHADNKVAVVIDGKDYAINGRGMSFVLYDKVTNSVLDNIHFDTFSRDFDCMRSNYLNEKMIEYQNENPDVFLFSLQKPDSPRTNLSENEALIFATNGKLEDVLHVPKSYHDINGVRQYEDFRGTFVNTVGGHRVTTGQPREYNRSIFIVGNGDIFGIGASDERTIPSHLQALFADFLPEQQIVVHNYGYCLEEGDARLYEEVTILNSIPVQSGDIVICDFGNSRHVSNLDLSRIFQRPHDYGEPFFDTKHYSQDGYQAIAKEIFNKLRTSDILSLDVRTRTHHDGIAYRFDHTINQKLQDYRDRLYKLYKEMFLPKGVVVLNANPFTLGHRHLIETAAAQVNHLFIFIVREDSSIFPLEDRIKMVEAGVADIENVTVIPSERFVISETQNRVVDSALDVTTFAYEIAPVLNVRVRFTGEELHDTSVNQYNQILRTTLPQYGIGFVELPWKVIEGNPVTSSYVRSLLKEKNFDELAKFVPQSTLDYLLEKYHS